MDNQAIKYKEVGVFHTKLELGEIFIKDIRFNDKIRIRSGMLYANKEEVEKLVLEDDKLTGCHVDIVRPDESAGITPVKDVIGPRVEVSGGEILPGVIGKVSPQVGIRRTHALESCCIVTVGKIVGFQEGVIDMGDPAADCYPFSQTYNLYVVVEPADSLETHAYGKAARITGLKVVTYIGETAREPEPDETATYETKPIFEQAAMHPNLPKVGYIHMSQSQGLPYGIYYYGMNAKQFIPTFMYPTEIMDGVIVSGNCIIPCDKAITYHHFHNPVVEGCYRHHGKDVNLMDVVLTNGNAFLADKEYHFDMVAKLCSRMELDGVLTTEEGHGNPDTDLIMNCHKVGHMGTKVVLITDEFPGKDGKSQPLADVCEETGALASYGQGNTTLQSPVMDKVIGAQDFIEMQIGGRDGCKNPDGSFEAELQIIAISTIANGFNKPAVGGY